MWKGYEEALASITMHDVRNGLVVADRTSSVSQTDG